MHLHGISSGGSDKAMFRSKSIVARSEFDDEEAFVFSPSPKELDTVVRGTTGTVIIASLLRGLELDDEEVLSTEVDGNNEGFGAVMGGTTATDMVGALLRC